MRALQKDPNGCMSCGHDFDAHSEEGCLVDGCPCDWEFLPLPSSPGDAPFANAQFLHDQIEKEQPFLCLYCGHTSTAHSCSIEGSGLNFRCLAYGCKCQKYINPDNPMAGNPWKTPSKTFPQETNKRASQPIEKMKASGMTVSEICRKVHWQDCSNCEDFECCDNTNQNKTPLPKTLENLLYTLIETWTQEAICLLQKSEEKTTSPYLRNAFLENATTREICVRELLEILCQYKNQTTQVASVSGHQEIARCDCAQQQYSSKKKIPGPHHRHPSVRSDGYPPCPLYRKHKSPTKL